MDVQIWHGVPLGVLVAVVGLVLIWTASRSDDPDFSLGGMLFIGGLLLAVGSFVVASN